MSWCLWLGMFLRHRGKTSARKRERIREKEQEREREGEALAAPRNTARWSSAPLQMMVDNGTALTPQLPSPRMTEGQPHFDEDDKSISRNRSCGWSIWCPGPGSRSSDSHLPGPWAEPGSAAPALHPACRGPYVGGCYQGSGSSPLVVLGNEGTGSRLAVTHVGLFCSLPFQLNFFSFGSLPPRHIHVHIQTHTAVCAGSQRFLSLVRSLTSCKHTNKYSI